MKEVTTTIFKRYDENGKLLEHTETTVEKDIVYSPNTVSNPSFPITVPGIIYTGDPPNIDQYTKITCNV